MIKSSFASIVRLLAVLTVGLAVGSLVGCGGRDANPPPSSSHAPTLHSSNGTSAKALHLAAMIGDINKMRMLLADGYPVDIADPTSGWTALFLASAGEHEDAVALLLKEGADVSIRGVGDDSALLHAALRGNIQIVSLLLGHGADPNIATKDGSTPLMAAARAGDIRVVNLLLKAGADPTAMDRNGRTAIQIASEQRHTDIVQRLRRIETENGAGANAR